MTQKIQFPKHTCQSCGSERKFVETIIDDEFMWDAQLQMYVPDKFADMFEQTGFVRCAECNKVWSGK